MDVCVYLGSFGDKNQVKIILLNCDTQTAITPIIANLQSPALLQTGLLPLKKKKKIMESRTRDRKKKSDIIEVLIHAPASGVSCTGSWTPIILVGPLQLRIFCGSVILFCLC